MRDWCAIRFIFRFGVRLRGQSAELKAGEYAIPAHASMADIMAILVSGKSIQHKLTAAEGLTSQMIHDIVKADPVLTGDAGAVPAEGTLLPETYLFTRGVSRAEMIARMEKAQKELLTKLWPVRAADLPFTTEQEAIVLASIVEKETALPDERRHIAAVFENRLRLGMKLQSDPTIIYGLTRGYPLGRGIRESELSGATPYNTYVIAGLPPTPICNPGKDAIAAVLNPADPRKTFISWPTARAGMYFPPPSPSTTRMSPNGARSSMKRSPHLHLPPRGEVGERMRAGWGVDTDKIPPPDPPHFARRIDLPALGEVKRSFLVHGHSAKFVHTRSPVMAIVSMTGFAEAHGAHELLRWRWEVKSVNGRGLELRLRAPPGFDAIEAAARMLANERFKRGNIQATLNFEPQENARGLRVDASALAAAVKIAREVAQETGLAPARVDGLLALKGVIVQDDVIMSDGSRAGRDAAVLETLATAFDALRRVRRNEGVKLSGILTAQIGEVEKLTREAGALAATQPGALRDKFEAQLKELLGSISIPEERLAQEVALLATRGDVREELDRLGAHVGEARTLLASGEAVGRKLDFLAQEFNREANTLCSKSSDIALTRTGLALKAAIDQFREQAQNVE